MGCAAGAALREAQLREGDAEKRAEELSKQLQESEEEKSQLRIRLEALVEGTSVNVSADDLQPMTPDSSRPVQVLERDPPQPASLEAAASRAAAVTLPGVVSSDESAEEQALEAAKGSESGTPGDRTNRHGATRDISAVSTLSRAESRDFVLPGGMSREAPSASSTLRGGRGAGSSSSSASWQRPGSSFVVPGSELSASHLAPKAVDLPDVPQEDALLRSSREGGDSTASTCTTGTQLLTASSLNCYQCRGAGLDLYLDHSDMNRYCQQCWLQFYGEIPSHKELLVPVEVADIWSERRLERAWAERKLHGWPPAPAHPPTAPSVREGEVWSNVKVRLRRDIVGLHAREQRQRESVRPGETLAGRYRVEDGVGEGHFTRAFAAVDFVTGKRVCLKRHHNLSVDSLTDLLVLAKRLEQADALGQSFPRLMDAFYDIVGYTIESLVEGQNCLALAKAQPGYFDHIDHLRTVAHGALSGLVLLDRAGIVHNDLKPDNLVWVEAGAGSPRSSTSSRAGAAQPTVRIVDFGCARLDRREEPGRNWSLAEGGAGHLGKWSPEMVLRLPITHRGDVWGLAISLCELHCGRSAWCHECDTAEVVMAQSLGLCGHREGLPSSLLRRSPLDVRKLYTPAPRHWPVRRESSGQLQVLQPQRWGLEVVLGSDWGAGEKRDLGDLLRRALVLDAEHRPSAAELLDACALVAER